MVFSRITHQTSAIYASMAGRWIGGLVDRLSAGPAAHALSALAIATIAADVNGQTNAETIQPFIEILNRRSFESLLDSSPSLVLLCACIADRCGGRAPAVLMDYAELSASGIRGQPSGVSDPSLILPALLAWQLGLLAGPPQAYESSVEPERLIGSGPEAARSAMVVLEACTMFGLRRVSTPPLLAEVLEAIAVDRLQDYDLELACRVMRARRYVDSTTSLAVTEFRDFIVANQDDEGSFGLYDRESEVLRTAANSKSADLSLKLPVTLACLWTLAEMDRDDYLIVRDIGMSCRSS